MQISSVLFAVEFFKAFVADRDIGRYEDLARSLAAFDYLEAVKDLRVIKRSVVDLEDRCALGRLLFNEPYELIDFFFIALRKDLNVRTEVCYGTRDTA